MIVNILVNEHWIGGNHNIDDKTKAINPVIEHILTLAQNFD